jgi:cytosine/adenosine deaminase-related metal-dependent hydrolase
MFKPHLYPLNMPVYRVAYFANGNDVDTVIVNGEVLMEQRRVRTVNEAEVLELAQLEADNAIRRTGLAHLLAVPDRFWNVTRGLK